MKKKIVFVVITSSHSNHNESYQELVTNPELDKLLEEGWKIKITENVTPPASIAKSIIKIDLEKAK